MVSRRFHLCKGEVTAAQMKKSVLAHKILSGLFLPVCYMPHGFFLQEQMVNSYLFKIKSFVFYEYVYLYKLLNSEQIFFCSIHCRINWMEAEGTRHFVYINWVLWCSKCVSFVTKWSWKSCGAGSTGGRCNDQNRDRHWTASCNADSCCRVGTAFLSGFRYLQTNLLLF